MKLFAITASLVLVVASSLALRLHADETAASDPFTPGPQHAMLKKYAGTWKTETITVGPDGKEQRSMGTNTTVVSTNFNTVDEFRGDFMGMKFEGHGVNGFCGVRNQYFTIWTDSMTSSPLIAFGTYDAEKRELTLKGECVGMSGKLEPCRLLKQYRDDDHYAFELHGAGPDGKEARHLRVEYTRVK